MDVTSRSKYESFPSRLSFKGTEEILRFNEPASAEYQAWMRAFQSVPRGVLARKFEEDEAQRRLEEEFAKQREFELSMQGPEFEAWMPDELCKTCYQCEEPFTLIKRRHHCRICGLVFCGNCSSHYLSGQNFGFGNVQIRACDDCYEIRNKRFDSNRSSKGISSSNKVGKPDRMKTLAHPEDDSSHTPGTPRDEEFEETSSKQSQIMDDSDGEYEGESGQHEDDSVVSHLDNTMEDRRSRERPKIAAQLDSIQAAPSAPSTLQRAISALRKREDRLLESLLVGESSVWRDCLMHMAKSGCDTVVPEPVLYGDALDVCEYIRIQLIPGGTPSSSMKVNGAVLRKNVVDRFMAKNKSRPRILLLESGLELIRNQHKIVSFDKLLEQERLYLEFVVRKIASVRADVVLVGGTVSGMAQEMLREKNIAVASLMNAKDLQWIARLTGATILPTTEYINMTMDPTGTCDSWRCETIDISIDSASHTDSNKHPSHRSNANLDTFMFFEGCMVEKGCTLCLRGAPYSELQQKSMILQYVLKRLWTIRLDHSFLISMDAEDAISRGRLENPYGIYGPALDSSANSDLLVLESDSIETGRIWLQNAVQQHSIPETSTRAFYGTRDRAFGDFLLRYCFDSTKMTNNMADGNFSMVFVHGHGRIRISAERLAKSDASDFTALRVGMDVDERLRILTWGVCRSCGEQTNVRCLDKSVMGMSFAKWLQNIFYLDGLRSSSRHCEHSLLHDYLRFFFKGDFVVTMEFDSVTPLSFIPPDRLNLKESSWYDAAADQLREELVATCAEVVAAFHEAPFLHPSAVENRLVDLQQEADTLKSLKTIRYSPSEMNRLFRDLFVSCVEWNARILNPSSESLPSQAPALASPRAMHLRSFQSASANDPLRPQPRFSNLSSEPRLKRRPSLPEIRQARTKILGKALADPLETSRTEDGETQQVDVPKAPTTNVMRSISSSSSSIASLVTRSAPPLGSSPKSPKRRAIPLPARLVEGHLLLPPGKRLGNAVIPVRESEPTSWIAHALCSDEYAAKLQSLVLWSHSDWEKVLLSLSREHHADEPQVVSEEAMHIHCGFTDASEYSARQCAFSVRSFYAAQFHALRILYAKRGWDGDERILDRRFVESLSRCTVWKPTGGKSKATFLKTQDDRFIVKSVSQEEFEMFQELAPKYFSHLANVFGAKGCPSVLVPFLGLFSVTMQSEVVVGMKRKSGLGNIHNKLLVVVSPNIFWQQSPKVMYDLKGNLRNRLMRNPEDGAVRLDVNFFQDQRGVPLSLEPEAKETLTRAVSNDAAFLASVGVVDYSLLVGIDDKVMTAGIIDYLQLYNYKKMFESTVKKAAGQAEPTVVSPRKYQARFVASMDRYFLSSGTPLLVPKEEMKNKDDSD